MKLRRKTFTSLLAMILCLTIVTPSLAGTIQIPSGVQHIEQESFYGDKSLDEVILPEGIREIGKKAFADSSVKSVNLPDSLVYIAGDAFDADHDISFSANSGTYAEKWLEDKGIIEAGSSEESDQNDFEINDNKDGTCSISKYVGTGGAVTIPRKINGLIVTSIGDDAFSDCESLTNITIPNSVTSIGDDAFRYCRSLTSITIPNSVTSIGARAFSICQSLKSITIPNSVTSIGDEAFYQCFNLTSITISNSVTSIGNEAFYCCSKLTSITIPNNVTSIGDEAFYQCYNLTSITIPNSVTSIGDYAFYCCYGLTSITIPNNVTSIGKSTFAGCGLTSITIPNSVTSIGASAFSGCRSLTSITIPNSVTSIGASAFSGCSLTSITIPNSVTSIGAGAFANCRSLTSITIPNSVTSIGGSAFKDCSSLTSITIPSSVTSIGDSAFANCSSLTSITIPNSVTIIGVDAFEYCSSLTSITIPNSVTSIGYGAFSHCISLINITIPKSVTSIGNYSFFYCSSLTNITIPSSVTSIGAGVFADCSSLTNITIPSSVTSIGTGVFANCSSLSSITIPNSVTSIGYEAFEYCSNLTSITIPNSVTSIGYGAFANCSNLKSIYCPNPSDAWTRLVEMGYSESTTPALIPWDGTGEPRPESQYLSGQFSQSSMSVAMGCKVLASGWVSSGSKDIQRITLTVDGYEVPNDSDRYASGLFTDLHSTYIRLEDYAAYVLDTTRAPLNVPGTYTIRLWASTADRNGEELAQMTVTVVESSLTGTFEDSSLTIPLGQKIQLSGSVTTGVGEIDTVSLYIGEANTETPYASDRFIDHHTQQVSLKDWAAFTLDTTKEPLHQEGDYVIRLFAKLVNGQETELAQLSVTVVDRSLTGRFGQASLSLPVGTTCLAPGKVVSTGGEIERVTITIAGYRNSENSDRYGTDVFTDHHITEVSLADWAAFTLDTTREPLNQIGAYQIKLYAKTVSGTGRLLDTMDVYVTLPAISDPADPWDNRYGVVYTDESINIHTDKTGTGTVKVYVDGTDRGNLEPSDEGSERYFYPTGSLTEGKHEIGFSTVYGQQESEIKSIPVYSVTRLAREQQVEKYIPISVQMLQTPDSSKGYGLKFGDRVILMGTYGEDLAYICCDRRYGFIKANLLLDKETFDTLSKNAEEQEEENPNPQPTVTEEEFRTWAMNVINSYYYYYAMHQDSPHSGQNDFEFTNFDVVRDFIFRGGNTEITQINLRQEGMLDGFYSDYYLLSQYKLHYDFDGYKSTYSYIKCDDETAEEYRERMRPFYHRLLLKTLEEKAELDPGSFERLAKTKKGTYALKMNEETGKLEMVIDENGLMANIEEMADTAMAEAWVNFGIEALGTALNIANAYLSIQTPTANKYISGIKDAVLDGIKKLLETFSDTMFTNKKNILANNMESIMLMEISNARLQDYHRVIAYYENILAGNDDFYDPALVMDQGFRDTVEGVIDELEADKYQKSEEYAKSVLYEYYREGLKIEHVMSDDEIINALVMEFLNQILNVCISPIKTMIKEMDDDGYHALSGALNILIDVLKISITECVKHEITQSKTGSYQEFDTTDLMMKLSSTILSDVISVIQANKTEDYSGFNADEAGKMLRYEIEKILAKRIEKVYDLSVKYTKNGKRFTSSEIDTIRDELLGLLEDVYDAGQKAGGKFIWSQVALSAENIKDGFAAADKVKDNMAVAAALKVKDSILATAKALSDAYSATEKNLSNEQQISHCATAMTLAFKNSYPLENYLMMKLKGYLSQYNGLYQPMNHIVMEVIPLKELLYITDCIMLQAEFDLDGMDQLIMLLTEHETAAQTSTFMNELKKQIPAYWYNRMKTTTATGVRNEIFKSYDYWKTQWKDEYRDLVNAENP